MVACPCGSEKELDVCCAPYIGGHPAPNPEAVMRARYTAHTIGNLDYIERTCTEEAAQLFNRADLERSLPAVQWLGLEIRETNGGEGKDTEGLVNLVVRYRYGGRDFAQVEKASFRRVDGCWLYDRSEVNSKTPPVRVDRIGRNDLCPCGSGQKYKKCCGR